MKIKHGVKTDIKTIQKYAEDKGGKLLSSVYKNMNEKLEWQCNKGHKFTTTFNHVKNRNQWCPICGRIKASSSFKQNNKNKEHSKKISAGHQGVELSNWNGYISDYNRSKRKLNRHNIRYKEDIEYRLKYNLRSRLYRAIKNTQKVGSAIKDLGCSIEELKMYLESQFQEGMSWDNYGEWHIDHIKPLANYDLSNRNVLLELCHYTNLQPLWAKDNLNKSNKEDINECKQMDE